MTDAPITDPKALRALSHPFRWKLINLLNEEGPSTATQCSAKLGESVASCSYHLNMLAKYGFVAEVEGPGRQKPWQLVNRHQTITSEGLDDESAMAAEAAVVALLDNEYERTRERLRQHDRLPEEWRAPGGIGINSSTKFLTIDELIELQNELRAVLGRYSERMDRPELRPDGARPVRFFLSTTVSPD
ncbi:ArsR family transcriptional regulator [Lentzea atacamensis]|uniref:ArsR family transcriptional regulator n=2 Tax=Lentzea TaxID=165301 RepID=A0A316HVI0_9PSEU|nr:helix-turn-helix domain-containing protein [Lentzea atacamensis]PWK82331.1 ArsR family transcriptional regulator [Lentzea atacamensis]RAS64580.1 ArsR family transcriptional regulator [Lentzea atacamensis]